MKRLHIKRLHIKSLYMNKIIGSCVLVLCACLFAACGSSGGKEQEEYRQYGINCLESGKYEDAVKAFQNALDQSVGHIGVKELDICFYKARAQYLNGDSEAAAATYDAIIKYNKDARAYYLRGNLYFNLGEQERALEDYKAAIARDKNNYDLYIGIYETLSSNNQMQDGQQYLNQALEIKGDKPKDMLGKGRACYLLGDYEQAVSYLEKAHEAKEPLAPYYLGLAYEEQGDSASAETYIKQYLDSGVASSYDLYELGVQELADGDYEQALVYFNAGLAMETVPNKQNLMRSAIAAYEYGGDFSSAGQMMEEYIGLYPSDQQAQKEKTFLETR